MSPVVVPAHGRSPAARTRTCIGCRERADAADLLRVAAVRLDGGVVVVPNHRGTVPGRGASVHPVVGCLDLAERRRAFRRALRLPEEPDVSAVRDWVRTTEIDGRTTGPVGQQ